MSALQEWLRYTPEPYALTPPQRWHVFLSYRSVHRPWVLQLYDVLRHRGFEVFMDQYALAASAHLVGSLEEGMSQSASGILVWSATAEDSRWCEKEYRSMETRATRDEHFHYVIALLGDVRLPLFASERLHLDFSAHREGPTGSGLLRLFYGIIGKPLPDAAIRLATKVDEETGQALAAIRAATRNGDIARLLDLGRGAGLAWSTVSTLGCEVVEALTKLRRYDDALTLISDLKSRFPKAIRPRQLEGLALARKGDWRAAQTVLGELEAAGEQDPETLGIYARTWMDRYEESRNELYLRQSRDMYVRAFESAPGEYYTGINAAAKSVLLGDLVSAVTYADRVEKLVGGLKREGDYWMTATVAEVQLIKRAFESAAELYRAAVAMAPEERGSHETTWLQARRLLDKLEATPADRAAVGRAFAHLEGPP